MSSEVRTASWKHSLYSWDLPSNPISSSSGAGNLKLGWKAFFFLSYLTIPHVSIKQVLLPFAIQMFLHVFVMVESIVFRERWKCDLRSWARLPE